jgi:hypothetical protein
VYNGASVRFSLRFILPLVVLAIVASSVVYRTQATIDWPKTFEALNNVAQILALVVGGWWALKRFGITRESRTFLNVTVRGQVVGGGGSSLLTLVTVRLENLGGARIDARTTAHGVGGGFLYDDGWDQLEHAGTLKLRAVLPTQRLPTLFDWYVLRPLDSSLAIAAKFSAPGHVKGPPIGTLEQVNYLADFLDSATQFSQSDFWLEPGEAHEASVMLWLPPGDYAIKAYFLGSVTAHREEEYWSSTTLFHCELPPVGSAQ